MFKNLAMAHRVRYRWRAIGPFIKERKENVSVRGLGKVLGLLAALMAAAQMRRGVAQFMDAMNESMERMDRQMTNARMNGNVDHDFASMMIPHHQGAVDMAKAELIYGKDPVMRRLAPEILVDQQLKSSKGWPSRPQSAREGPDHDFGASGVQHPCLTSLLCRRSSIVLAIGLASIRQHCHQIRGRSHCP